jgi:type VII secretion integral membrane protein EccD
VTDTALERSGLVRVSVLSGDRRYDVALPAVVPVAELLPEVIRAVGALDPQTVHGGYFLVTAEGRRLSGEAGLTLQGVEDGAVLTVARGVDDKPPRVYDDIVEAMADVVESEMRPWEPAAGRATALSGAAVVLGLGALSLGLERADLVAGAVAAVVALVLAAAAVVVSRVKQETQAALVLAWAAIGYAVVAGATLPPEGPFLAMPASFAGLGAVVAGVIGLAGLAERRTLMVPAVAVGGIAAVAGGLVSVTDLPAAGVFVTALVLTVVAGSTLPWVALGATGTRVDQAHSAADLTADPADIDNDAVRTDARAGHELLLAITATVGLLVVLVAPLAVGLGVAGTLLAVAAALVLMLRTRQYRVGTEVAVGLVSGLAGLVAVALSVLVLQPGWRPVLAVLLAVIAAAVLVLTLVPSGPSVRRGRLGDVAEVVALVALLPLWVVATGLFAAVLG